MRVYVWAYVNELQNHSRKGLHVYDKMQYQHVLIRKNDLSHPPQHPTLQPSSTLCFTYAVATQGKVDVSKMKPGQGGMSPLRPIGSCLPTLWWFPPFLSVLFHPVLRAIPLLRV